MTLKDSAQAPLFEPRWPVGLAILAVLFLLMALPGRIQLFPNWTVYVVAVAVLAPMAAVGLTAARPRWLRVERTVTLLFFVIAAVVTLANLVNLIGAMVRRPADISGLQLLASSIAVWVTNVLMFSLLYWQIDRGGPEAGRTMRARGRTGSSRKRGLPPRTCHPAGGRRSSTTCSSATRPRRRSAPPMSCR